MGEKSPSYDALFNQNIILKDVINSSWNALGIISLEGSFKFVNNAFVPILGYSHGELLKMGIVDILLQEYIQPFKDLLKDNTKNQYINKLTIGCKRKDNQTVYLEIVINLMTNKKLFVVNVHEVTATVNEKKLIDQFIIKFNMDKDGNLLDASKAFYRLSGHSYDKIVFNNYKTLLTSESEDENFEAFITSINNGKPWSGSLKIKKADNGILLVDFACHPTRNKYGDIIGFSAVMIDMTSQQQLLEHEEFLEKKLIDEEEKLSIMSETIRTVAHEWRQPLNTISLDAQSLAFDEEVDKENIKEKLEGISKSTEKLSQVIENFQSFTEPKGSKKKRNIKDILLEAIRISELDEKEFLEEVHETSRSFRTYPKELASALSTILINAREYTSIIDDPHILLKTYEKNNNIICEISNNGGHIPTEIKEKIFTPYFSTKKEKNGVGLSLYTCKMIVELHLKGAISVTNEDDNYVKFKLTFPIGALEE
jgi:PAS domain S-box-containing protein